MLVPRSFLHSPAARGLPERSFYDQESSYNQDRETLGFLSFQEEVRVRGF